MISQISLPLVCNAVRVRVPASCANLGPGFDCLGIALDIWDDLTVEVSSTEQLEITGAYAADIPRDGSNLIFAGMRAAFQLAAALTADQGSATFVPEDKYRHFRVVHNLCAMLKGCRAGSPIANKKRDAGNTDGKDEQDSGTRPHTIFSPFVALPPFRYTCVKSIPVGQGLGSSSAALVSGLVAGFRLLGISYPNTAVQSYVLFNLSCAMEGHPDNVGPTIYGGAQIGFREMPVDSNSCFTPNSITLEPRDRSSSNVVVVREPTPSETLPAASISGLVHTTSVFPESWNIKRVPLTLVPLCVIFLPNYSVPTRSARASIPPFIARSDCIFNISRSALLISALMSGELYELRFATQDRIHQPFRGAALMPHLYPIIDAALHHGAYGAFLSGAGPAVMAFVPNTDNLRPGNNNNVKQLHTLYTRFRSRPSKIHTFFVVRMSLLLDLHDLLPFSTLVVGSLFGERTRSRVYIIWCCTYTSILGINPPGTATIVSRVSSAMVAAAQSVGVSGTAVVTRLSEHGVIVAETS